MNKWLNGAFPIMLMHLSMGGVYAWSFFVAPLENLTGWNAMQVQIPFSLVIFFIAVSSAVGELKIKKKLRSLAILNVLVFIFGLFLAYKGVQRKSLVLLCLGYGPFVGTATGMMFSIGTKIIGKLFDWRSNAMTWISIAGFGTSVALISPVILYFSETEGPESAFKAILILYSVISIPAIFLFREPPESDELPDDDSFRILPMLKNKTFRQIWLMFFIIMSCGMAVISAAAPMTQMAGGSKTVAITILIAALFCNGEGRMLFPRWSDKLHNRGHIYYALFALSFMAVSYGMFFPHTLYIGMLIIAACYGAGISCLPALVSDRFGMLHTKKIYSLMLLAWAAAALFGNQISAYIWIITDSRPFVMWMWCLLYILGWMICAVVNRKNLFLGFSSTGPSSGKSGRITRIGDTTRQVFVRIRERNADRKRSSLP